MLLLLFLTSTQQEGGGRLGRCAVLFRWAVFYNVWYTARGFYSAVQEGSRGRARGEASCSTCELFSVVYGIQHEAFIQCMVYSTRLLFNVWYTAWGFYSRYKKESRGRALGEACSTCELFSVMYGIQHEAFIQRYKKESRVLYRCYTVQKLCGTVLQRLIIDFVAAPKILSQIFAHNTELSREKWLSSVIIIEDCSISCFCFLCLYFCLCVLLRFAVVVCLLLYFCCFVLWCHWLYW